MQKLNAKRRATGYWMLLEEPAGHRATSTEKGQDKNVTAVDFELWGTAHCNPSYQIMELVKAGGHKDDDTLDYFPASSAFRSQGLWQKYANLCCYRLSVDLLQSCKKHIKQSKKEQRQKPLQCFYTGLWGLLGHLHTSYYKTVKF